MINRYRSIWISDLHLGTKYCKAEKLLSFLDKNQANTWFLVDDIMTTGQSFLDMKIKVIKERNLSIQFTEFYGVVIFNRSGRITNPNYWIYSIFDLNDRWLDE